MPDQPLSASEQRVLLAAAYIKGAFAGVMADRTFAWKNRFQSSWLSETRVYAQASAILRGEKLFNPIELSDILACAQQLGFDDPPNRARELIEIALKTPSGPEFQPSKAKSKRPRDA